MYEEGEIMSDGEAVRRDEEKAIDTTIRATANSSINTSARLPISNSSRSSQPSHHRNGRRLSRSRSRSRSPYRASKDAKSQYRSERKRSRSPYRAKRPRSRSPYRADRAGERSHNRGFSGDGTDKRQFKVHHEDEKREHNNRPGSRHGEKLDTMERPSKRMRSRSPFRRSTAIQPSKVHASSTSQLSASRNDAASSDKPSEKPSSFTKQKADPIDSLGNRPMVDSTSVEEKDQPKAQLSEAEAIEERRRRREAIRAKHKSQQPLLVQALDHNLADTANQPASPIDTLNTASRMYGPKNDSTATNECSAQSPLETPQTPTTTHSPGSPAPFSPSSFTVDNPADIVHVGNADDNDGPAAADYDPAMDMQDRRDLVKDEPKQSEVDAEEKGGDVDMFADEEDDMFASPTGKPAKVITAIRKAKTLDQSLLDNWDYPDGHYRIIIGELLDGRYAVEQQIGKGTFATVVRAKDVKTGDLVAVKIACNNETMYKAGTKEMGFLNILNETDSEDKRHIIRLLGNFDHKGHMCLVFENLSADLRETLKKYGRNVGLNLTALRIFAYQMFQALLHLQRNEILHADLKPDNILVNDKLNMLKICDVGTASKITDAEITPYLVSRFYRAPEIMLGIPLDYAIDMWSIGCTLYELYTGRILFAGADNNQMLKAIQECRGKVPNRMLKKSTLFDRHFDQFGNFISIEKDKITGQTAMRQPNLTKIAPGKDLRSRVMSNVKNPSPTDLKEIQAFVDLLEKCLQLDPLKRITPSDALKHVFITHGKDTSSEKPAKKIIPAMAPARVR